ncbi:ADP-ribose pyrophosphatase [Apiospora marii]|uniref:ADP-ribose pyrophosphatase n=1 Tax=Apiospora marii TaxID=335849 RepID=A0ABR1RJ54_9PEZI
MAAPGIQTGQEPRTGILDLPLELLSLTFENFRVEVEEYRYMLDCKERRDATKALRLTCRRLSDAATPILFSALTIDLSKESLSRAEELVSRNAHVAASVRKVVISLASYTLGMADDMALFVESRLEDIKKMCLHYDSDWHMLRSDLKQKAPEEIKCLRNGCRIFDAWDKDGYLDHDEDYDVYGYEGETERESAIRNYRGLIWKAHDTYHGKHREQLELVEGGSFVQSVVRCLGHLRHECLQFIITDGMKSPYHESAYIINDNEQLLSAMSAPHGWLDSYKNRSDEGEVSLPAARLLSEIPIACYRAGAPITDLSIVCFPIWGQLSLLVPGAPSLSPMSELPAELGTACQQLEKFEFGYEGMSFLCPVWQLRRPMSPPDRIYANSFFKAMISGGNLTTVHINMLVFGHGVPSGHPEYRYFDLGPVLEEMTWTKVQAVELSGFEIRQDALENMFRKLDGGALRVLDLASVQLRGDGGGSWADALEVLRDNLACRGDDVFDCDVRFEDLEGGGLEVLYSTPRKWDRDVDELEEGDEFCPWTPEEVSEEAMYFVMGLCAENPLRYG